MASQASKFVERSHYRGFLALLKDWGAIFLLAALSIKLNNIFAYLITIWIIGAFQFAIGESLIHEASHYNLFKIKSWNENLEFLYALPFFQTISQYQAAHVPHHQYLGKKGDHLVEDYEEWGLSQSFPNLWLIWFVKPILGFAVFTHLATLKFSGFKTVIKLVCFWLPISLLFYFYNHLDWLILYWFVPFIWCFTSYLYWSEIEDHYQTISGTRSNLSMLNNFLSHNNGYHYAHHFCPTIPWYKLPEAHRELCSDNPDISYGFLDTYKQMKMRTNQTDYDSAEISSTMDN
ncbi:fatty acid desaturase family protein [Crocosphaera sp. XPORK-15E]|uniref:fatty acid desaturase family protein n=1 Tax=Crocosphaera sp. XPORK-15E TaxID=3110247 RepID=UPI002B217575|nr:fatty acid desaturase [Crocosphaera sp. XPORK-15E]MEA5532963.1 fatty acid desaturase [Crocosphaera sp. XPORK-15E]